MTPQRYRFIVGSADEAVSLIQQRLGPEARVVSVRQVEGKGLARFLRTPKLEVTAEVAAPEPKTEKAEASGVAFPTPESEAAAGAATVKTTVPMPETVAPASSGEDSLLLRLVRSAGISGPVLTRLRAHARWPEIERLPAGVALTRVAALLTAELRQAPRRLLGNRIVFLGGPGAGITTALCKQLATDIMVRRKQGAVLKLDLDSANPGDGLSVFCEAMGVPCHRGVAEVSALDEETLLYVDLPGVPLDDLPQLERLAEELTPIGATSHVLVVNAAYDRSILKHLCAVGEQIGCTHLVLTHCDELIHWGKLWDVLLGTKLTPLFLGAGQNVAGDLEENVVPAILARTFPTLGKEAAEDAVAS